VSANLMFQIVNDNTKKQCFEPVASEKRSSIVN
jgi:hypothetical protein